ncbi:MAG: hypothetical protein IJW16_03325, partial [Clostridia bacterium]|nr:hypothetical protein [Clostridia bacterium]
MDQTYKQAWQQYEAGREYKRRIGLYETVRKNERFYRGDQWSGSVADLPHPVFNLVRRITDHLVGSILPGDLSIHYSDDRLPFLDNALTQHAVRQGLAALDRHALYRWKQNHMNELCEQALTDAAISGDAVFYCWWDGDADCGHLYHGDIRTELIPSSDLFVANVQSTDLQTQEYVILAGRASVDALRAEAAEAGVSTSDRARILPDSESDLDADRASIDATDGEFATYLVKFYRDGGEVVFEKSTADCLIRRVRTGLSLYPVAYFNWFPTKRSFHGTPLISDILPNQTYVNTAYAMMMKHMRDTAFSKIIYDK